VNFIKWAIDIYNNPERYLMTQEPGEGKEVKLLSNDEYTILEALKEARSQRKEWEEQEARCRAALLRSVGDSDLLYYEGNYVAEIETRSSTRFDRKTFAKDWPKLDEEYRTETESKVVNITIEEG
jgi:hypothetical protein